MQERPNPQADAPVRHDFRLIVFDLDGTALTQSGELSERVRAALTRAAGEGRFLALATGRPPSMIPQEIMDLPLRCAIVGSGALVLNGDEVLHDQPLDRALALELYDQAHAFGARAMAGFAERAVWEQGSMRSLIRLARREFSPALVRRIRAMITSVDIHKSAREAIATRSGRLTKLDFEYPSEDIQRDQRQVLAARGDVEVAGGLGLTIEVTAAGVTKGSGLRIVRERLGLAPNQVLAIGDSSNDLPMRSECGYFVATGNASDEVKAVADMVTSDCDHDGVADALTRLLGWGDDDVSDQDGARRRQRNHMKGAPRQRDIGREIREVI